MLPAREFQYIVLEKSSITTSSYLDLYCQAFEFWKDTWKAIFEKVGSPQAFMIDDFYRQEIIPIIVRNGRIVGANFYTIFDLKNPAAREMRYFSIFPPSAIAWVMRNGQKQVMTMEFLSVHPDWRRKGGDFSFAEVLISLGFEVMRSRGIGAAVGVAVKVTGVNEMAKNLSCRVLAEEVKRGNLVCDILCQVEHEVRKHKDPKVRAFVSTLWENHINSNEYQKVYKGAA